MPGRTIRLDQWFCMDEASRQLIEEERKRFIDSHGITHIDNEYIRHGEQKIFLATETTG